LRKRKMDINGNRLKIWIEIEADNICRKQLLLVCYNDHYKPFQLYSHLYQIFNLTEKTKFT
jgi:hypothetical protein